MATGATVPVPGGWTNVDIDDDVISLGRWAVDEHNKNQNAQLEFKKVTNARSQMVAGVNYCLTLEAADGGENKFYDALVFVSLANVKELREFKPLLLRGQA